MKRAILLSSLLALAASTLPPASAATAAEPPPAAPVALQGVGPGPHVITLVTGDKVTLTQAGTGRFEVKTEPATRQDGHRPRLVTQTTPEGVFVLPEDAMPAIQAGRLDRRLFDVRYLAENGYADDRTKQVPVIVQYPGEREPAAVKKSAEAIPASVPTHDLDSINASAMNVAKAEAAAFWNAVRTVPSAGLKAPDTLSGGIAKVWLDGKAKAFLDKSVPMIGAPAAWAGGYDGTGVKVAVLDTGIDATHPDLEGKIADSKSFVPDSPVTDRHGHGTHVAATISGSGAASGGTHKGVAPGAQLVVGKVLDDAGSGYDSWIIEGMEWAASSGAKVVSMSLGAGPTDGTDPISQAVNDLSASTGTLFVIAAGNSGALPGTVAAPGTAEAALTVAAVDKQDQMADFSGRGPRFGDSGLKPDIAAPGVDIAAARAAGTTMGTPVDDRYTSASGTSMATPHVAGAAAIMAQLHPDWKGPLLKSALMSTAKDDGFSVYEQGAGRVDLAKAHTQRVFATTAGIGFGSVTEEGEPLRRALSYSNLTDQPVTLTLTPALRTAGGTAVEERLSTDPTLTVPAGGTATATVTLDTAGLDLSSYSGSVTAEADGIRLTTPVGVVREAPLVQLTVHTIGRDGQPAAPWYQQTLDVDGEKGYLGGTVVSREGTTVTRVPVGTHSVMQLLGTVDSDDRYNETFLISPEVTVTGDTEITLDARQASQVRFSTPKPAEPLNNIWVVATQRTIANGQPYGTTVTSGLQHGAWAKVWAIPTKPVTKGKFRFAGQWTLGHAQVTMTAGRHKPITLNPVAPQHIDFGTGPIQGNQPDWKPFTGTRTLPLVDVGAGRAEDIAGKDLRGKLILMETGPAPDGGLKCWAWISQIIAIREAGAAGVAIFPSKSGLCALPISVEQELNTGDPKPISIPNVSLSNREGLKLRARLASEPVSVQVTGTPDTPYTYVLKPYAEGSVPKSLHHTLTRKQLVQVDLDVHASQPARFNNWRTLYKQDDVIATTTSTSDFGSMAFTGPTTRTEWIGPVDPTVIHSHGMSSSNLERTTFYDTRFRAEVFDRPGRTRQQWFTAGLTPGAQTASDRVYALADKDAPPLTTQGIDLTCMICVQGDTLWAEFAPSGTPDKHPVSSGFWKGDALLTPVYDLHLYRDGTEIPRVTRPGLDNLPAFTLPKGSGTYRLTAKNAQHDTEWTFRAPPAKEHVLPGSFCKYWIIEGVTEQCRPTPVVFAGYDLGDTLALDNTVRAGRSHRFTVEAYHSPSAAKMPKIAGLKLWMSTDDGAKWTSVKVKRDRDGAYTASTHYPSLRDTKGAVSLKVEAWDAEGNTLKQTSTRLFNLR
ncbi:S8 family serine peptidase [Nonomuraea glycinis]|uniref:Peptidase n=1 Tax=Nonomuraea glycinis TaxID=2047744 RepID=A0A918A2T8_9ACTN|nr:S8 family serine peptidase [Nonomuraea glycinis]MCA2175679.1 S8 family serine peptidase [Nonomuraea glycinis]GGP05165.1 peptidase [Nonomuraea glycinis]